MKRLVFISTLLLLIFACSRKQASDNQRTADSILLSNKQIQKSLFDTNDSTFDIDKILQSNNENEMSIKISKYIHKKSNYGKEIDKLTEPQKVFLYIDNLLTEVNNGGFNQFYTNSSGNFSHETVEALKTIGAYKTAKIVETANSQFPNNRVPKDRNIRIVVLRQIEIAANPVWDTLNNKFYRPNPKTGELEIDSASLLIRYILKNKEAFKD